MYTYKRTIKSGDMIEVEYYQSIRKIGKNYGGRKSNNSLSPAKMRKANKLRAVKHIQRLINANFQAVIFSAVFQRRTEHMKAKKNFVPRWVGGFTESITD